jgi:hypothetical protein
LIFGVDNVDVQYINAILCASVPSSQIGGLPVELASKVFDFTMNTPSFTKKRLVSALQRMQFCAKSVKYDLKPTKFLQRNFYFEIEGVLK